MSHANGAANGTANADAATPKDMRAYAAPSLFQPHRTRQAVRDAHEGKIAPLMGYYSGLASVVMTRFVAPIGFDIVWIDWEHASCNVETMTDMVHEVMFMSEGRTIPFVRVPGHDHAAIGFALDAGASIVIPQVNTVEEAKHVVSAAKFGSKSNGTRSAPPFRYVPGFTDKRINPELSFHQNLNEQAAIMIQIETLEAIQNLDAILTEVPDIDMVWLGSLDARISMNLAPPSMGMEDKEPEWVAALQLFNDTMKKHNKPRGGFAFPPPMGTPEVFQAQTDKLSFCVVAADVMQLMGMGQQFQAGKALVQAKPRTQ